jgi:hypothetical protein
LRGFFRGKREDIKERERERERIIIQSVLFHEIFRGDNGTCAPIRGRTTMQQRQRSKNRARLAHLFDGGRTLELHNNNNNAHFLVKYQAFPKTSLSFNLNKKGSYLRIRIQRRVHMTLGRNHIKSLTGPPKPFLKAHPQKNSTPLNKKNVFTHHILHPSIRENLCRERRGAVEASLRRHGLHRPI